MEKSDRMNDEKKIIHALQHTVNSVHGFPDKKTPERFCSDAVYV